MSSQLQHFDVFLSHSHVDAVWVENLAKRLTDEEGFGVWLDKWILIPGQPWQQAMAHGLENADSCAVCISEHTPTGWFSEEIQKALNRQTGDASFRVFAVLLPNAKTENIPAFVDLRTWVDFRDGADASYAFYLLACGIKGVAPGRWPPEEAANSDKGDSGVEVALRELKIYRQNRLIDDEIALEFQRVILERRFSKVHKE